MLQEAVANRIGPHQTYRKQLAVWNFDSWIDGCGQIHWIFRISLHPTGRKILRAQKLGIVRIEVDDVILTRRSLYGERIGKLNVTLDHVQPNNH